MAPALGSAAAKIVGLLLALVVIITAPRVESQVLNRAIEEGIVRLFAVPIEAREGGHLIADGTYRRGIMTIDLNYILMREQISLERAIHSRSLSARTVHKAFAKAYGRLLASSSFPHNALQSDLERKVLRDRRVRNEQASEEWDNEGGYIEPETIPHYASTQQNLEPV